MANPIANINLQPYLLDEIKKIAADSGFVAGYTIEQDEGSKHGDGFMSNMVNVKLAGRRQSADFEMNLICKLLPESKGRREMFSTTAAFEREITLYNEVLPKFVQFQEEKGLSSENGFFHFPKCYVACSNAELDRYYLIMDDLRPQGYQVWDKFKPIEYENVRLLMIALGRLHGLSFAMRDQRPAEFSTFRELKEFMWLAIMKTPIIDHIIQSTSGKLDGLFAAEEREFLRNANVTLKETFTDCFSDAEPFSVVGHGDCWNNNFLFYSSSSKAESISLIDWQLSRFGSPALDLSYFFMTSTEKPLRDQHMDEFLRIYHSEVVAVISACGSDADALFTFEDLQSELRRFGKYGVASAPMLLSIIVNKPENIAKMDDIADDTVENKEFAKFDQESAQNYVTRVTDVIKDAKSYGWIK